MNADHPPGPPMTLGNMRQQGARGLVVYCLNHACLHRGVNFERRLTAIRHFQHGPPAWGSRVMRPNAV